MAFCPAGRNILVGRLLLIFIGLICFAPCISTGEKLYFFSFAKQMEAYTFNIWSVLIGLGAFHGYLLALFLILRQKRFRHNYFAFLLLVVSIHLTEYTIAVSGLYEVFPHAIAASYPLLFLMGPFYYLYVRSLLDLKISGKSFWHYVPALLCFLALLPFYLQPGAEKLALITENLHQAEPTIPAGQFVFMIAHFLQLSIYIFRSNRLIRKQTDSIKEQASNPALEKLNLLEKFTQWFVAFLIFFLILLLVLIFVKQFRIWVDYVFLLMLSGSIHAIAYFILMQPEIFAGNGLARLNSKYQTSPLDSDKKSVLKNHLETYMRSAKPYLNSDLKISDLAEQLDIPSHHLSQIINQEYGLNFFDFVNQRRVAEAQKMLADNSYAHYTILAIAIEAGFNNKASFNRIFKKYTGMTPSAYKRYMR